MKPLKVLVGVILASLLGCDDAAPEPAAQAPAPPPTVERALVIGAYTTPREVFGQAILPAFAADWRARTGETVTFQESYQGSGAQARAVAGGFEADVVALSLAPDVEKLVAAGLVDAAWDDGPDRGIITHSLVVLAVRPGNPKGITDWKDLARPDVEVLTPNVRTSGGAMWNVAAVGGAALRGHTPAPAGDEAAAIRLLGDILGRVKVMDKGARESMLTFEQGVGDVAITYENEVRVAQKQGQAIEYVVPRSTLVIEAPAAVVGTYAERHGTRAVADAFVETLRAPASQKAFAAFGFRPLDAALLPAGLPVPVDAFTVADLGGWDGLRRRLFADGGAYDQALAAGRRAP